MICVLILCNINLIIVYYCCILSFLSLILKVRTSFKSAFKIIPYFNYFFFCKTDGLTKGTSHPVHLHGNRFYVLKYSTGEINETTGFTEGQNPDIQYSPDFRSAQWRNSSWKYGNVPGINIENPPQKDTVMVPFKGYVVIRLLADSPG